MAMALTMGAVTPASAASDSATGHVARTSPSRGGSPTQCGRHCGNASHTPPTVAPHVTPIMTGPVKRTGMLSEYLMVSLVPAHTAPTSRTASAPR